jgi:hypothetical protein
MFTKSLTAMALFGSLAAPAVAAHATPASAEAAGVKLAWSGGKVQVTWTEDTAAANTISLVRPGTADKQIGTTTAADANQVLVDPSVLEPTHDPAATAKIRVTGGGADALSAAFDRYIRGESAIAADLTAGQVVNWSAFDYSTDTTPNDPLDLDQLRYLPALVQDQCRVVQLPVRTASNGTIGNQSQPFNLKVYTASNWGESYLGVKPVRTSTLTMSAPSSTAFGSTISFTGGISLRQIKESGSTCVNADDPAKARIQIVLQARNSATSPWYAVGVANTDAQGKYSFSVPNPGAREYRTALNGSLNGDVQYQSITASKVVRATTRTMSAKFVAPVITLGQKPNAYLWVNPALSQTAALQYQTANGDWQGITSTTLSGGKGYSGEFNFNRRGVYSFRWWVSGSTTGTGLPVDAGYTNRFTLTIVS